jgi:hypothetical protein
MLVLSSSEFDPLLNLQIDQVMPGPAKSWMPARRAARESTSDRVIELTGWSITTGRRPCMPIARRVSSVSRTNFGRNNCDGWAASAGSFHPHVPFDEPPDLPFGIAVLQHPSDEIVVFLFGLAVLLRPE